MTRLGEVQLGTTQLGSPRGDEDGEYPEDFPELVESVAPAGPGTPAERILSHIKPAFDTDDPGWQAIIQAIAAEFDELEDAREEVLVSYFIETARGGSLDRLGAFVGTSRRSGEGDTVYRERLFAAFRRYQSGGTIDDIKYVSSTLLQTDPSEVRVEEHSEIEPARFTINVDGAVIDGSDHRFQDVVDDVEKTRAGGVRWLGTFYRSRAAGFEYRSVADFEDGTNDQEKSYNYGRYRGLWGNYTPEIAPDSYGTDRI